MLPALLAQRIDDLLSAGTFRDYGPNGLQVDAGIPIRQVTTATTASQAAIEAAQAAGSQALLVHHGLFWGREPVRLVGPLGRRVGALYRQGISLLAYHLPLDAHPTLGNNAVALAKLGIRDHAAFADQGVGRGGALPADVAIADLVQRCAQVFTHPVLHCPGGPDQVRTVAMVTGGGQGYLAEAARNGYDVLITGETSEQTWHEAAEWGIHCLACGHHATESLAVHGLGEHLAQDSGLTVHAFRPDVPV